MSTFRKIEESQTLLINVQSKNLEDQQKKVFKFGFGQSPFMPPESVLEALKLHVHHKEYSSVQGDYELRKLVSEFHFKANGIQVSAKNILIAPGSKILIYTILLSFKRADVFIQSPAWVSYAPQVQLAGHHAIAMVTTFDQRWRVTAESMQSAFANKKHKESVMILNYPGNPDGLTYTEEEIKLIADKARELNILVISDEIYGLLTHGKKHYSFSNYYPERTITTTGLSKWCGAGGWRLGIALLYEGIEKDCRNALIGIASETYSCTATPIQMAAKVAYGDYESTKAYIDMQNYILHKIGLYCYFQLIEAKIKLYKPEGGFYLFPDFSIFKEKFKKININTSTDLCNEIIQDTGVALLPGTAFGMKEDHFVARLSYVDFKDPLQNKNFHNVKTDFNLERDCPKIIEGIQLLKNWLLELKI